MEAQGSRLLFLYGAHASCGEAMHANLHSFELMRENVAGICDDFQVVQLARSERTVDRC